ncbi:hypothetical protein EYF80_006628 [Liparis tanakae]|uniref:Uncharacterized protein n=1 Tax=Liparis tanakae TaxID=230148 RepID=A0A4Z2IZ05_9TELE|nr:hypothetical protein EYF80_006628 [Liparis tanakae]
MERPRDPERGPPGTGNRGPLNGPGCALDHRCDDRSVGDLPRWPSGETLLGLYKLWQMDEDAS